MIRFALHVGDVISPNDGDVHHISAPALARLYGVSLRECVVVDPDRPDGVVGVDLDRLLHLYPSSQGAAYWPISESERRQYPIGER
jgi:hypothetical protein